MTEHNTEAVQAAAEAILPALAKTAHPDSSGEWSWLRSLAFDAAVAAVDAVTPHILAAAGKVITEDQAREIMQAAVEAQKPHLLAEVAAATDERLEQSLARVRVGIAAAIAAEKIPCPEHPMPFPKPSCWQCGRNGAFNRAALIAAGKYGTEGEQP